MLDPFEEVEPAPAIDPWQALTTELSRSMMWDMIGPVALRDEPTRFGQNPASTDVLEAEAEEMWARKRSLTAFGMDLPLLCHMAAETASRIIYGKEESMQHMNAEEIFQFRVRNVVLGTAIAETVVSHMLQKGLITYGETDEFLGQ